MVLYKVDVLSSPEPKIHVRYYHFFVCRHSLSVSFSHFNYFLTKPRAQMEPSFAEVPLQLSSTFYDFVQCVQIQYGFFRVSYAFWLAEILNLIFSETLHDKFLIYDHMSVKKKIPTCIFKLSLRWILTVYVLHQYLIGHRIIYILYKFICIHIIIKVGKKTLIEGVPGVE